MPKGLRPGKVTPTSGIYRPTAGGKEVALSKGDRVPPTSPGGTFILKTPTGKAPKK
jgi:hypothetical protein